MHLLYCSNNFCNYDIDVDPKVGTQKENTEHSSEVRKIY